jgi:Domain of unknown function (DUF5664)
MIPRMFKTFRDAQAYQMGWEDAMEERDAPNSVTGGQGFTDDGTPVGSVKDFWKRNGGSDLDGEDKANLAAYRKGGPIATGVMAYFPKALDLVARISKAGNDQHNPGEPMHWAREKSTDEADALARHLGDYLNGNDFDTDDQPHLAKVAWRALALLERWADGENPGRP